MEKVIAEGKDDTFPVLVERKVKFQPASGGELVSIVVQVGYPYWKEQDGFAACPVAFRGGIGRVMDICGEDLMQAAQLAFNFVDMYMQRSDGQGKFFWDSGDEY